MHTSKQNTLTTKDTKMNAYAQYSKIEFGTDNYPFIRGKYISTCYVESAFNETTGNIVIQILSLTDDRVINGEHSPEEANEKWKTLTGEALFH